MVGKSSDSKVSSSDLVSAQGSPIKVGDRWAVIVGISKYKHGILNLEYAHRDAEDLYELIQKPSGGEFHKDKIKFLCDEKATTANITRAIRSFLKKPARNDLVLIYMACHGAPDPDRPDILHLLPHDTDPNDIAGTALPMDEIDASLRRYLHAEKVVIIADTCHSAGIGGAIGRRGGLEASAQMNQYLQELDASKPGLALLTSAEANESSFEDEKWGGGHGVFTHYLLEGMKGEADTAPRNGIVTVGELFEYVRDNVKKATGNKQHPLIGTNPFDRNLPLAVPARERAVELHAEAQGYFETGAFDKASRSWTKLLEVYPDHSGAKEGLDKIRELERKRREALERRKRVLLKLKREKQLGAADYDSAMALLKRNPDELNEADREIRDFTEELTDNKISVATYLDSVELVKTRPEFEAKRKADEQEQLQAEAEKQRNAEQQAEAEKEREIEAKQKAEEKRKAEEKERVARDKKKIEGGKGASDPLIQPPSEPVFLSLIVSSLSWLQDRPIWVAPVALIALIMLPLLFVVRTQDDDLAMVSEPGVYLTVNASSGQTITAGMFSVVPTSERLYRPLTENRWPSSCERSVYTTAAASPKPASAIK